MHDTTLMATKTSSPMLKNPMLDHQKWNGKTFAGASFSAIVWQGMRIVMNPLNNQYRTSSGYLPRMTKKALTARLSLHLMSRMQFHHIDCGNKIGKALKRNPPLSSVLGMGTNGPLTQCNICDHLSWNWRFIQAPNMRSSFLWRSKISRYLYSRMRKCTDRPY